LSYFLYSIGYINNVCKGKKNILKISILKKGKLHLSWKKTTRFDYEIGWTIKIQKSHATGSMTERCKKKKVGTYTPFTEHPKACSSIEGKWSISHCFFR